MFKNSCRKFCSHFWKEPNMQKVFKGSRTHKIINLYKVHGHTNYYGENVSKSEHMLQCAKAAEKNLEPDYLILSCLLHDIGHFLLEDDTGGYGVAEHGKVGSEYLKNMQMDESVCNLVEKHVLAKRYLVSTDTNYYKELSKASLETLKYQGNKMSKSEIHNFECSPDFDNILKIRYYDEMGKKIFKYENNKLKKIEDYYSLIYKFLKF